MSASDLDSGPPSAEVLASFGVSDAPRPLEGGQGLTFQAGDVVMKRVDDKAAANWIANTLSSLPEAGFRVARPVKTITGDWLVGQWTAWEWVEGRADTSRWHQVVEAGRHFHATLGKLPRPSFLDTMNDPWRVADRMAWGERPLRLDPETETLAAPLEAIRRPIDIQSQMIHGDLAGNVLFADDLPPAIIDFSPYWRPADYAIAVVIADSLDWSGADSAIFDAYEHIPEIDQLVVRAELFRLAVYSTRPGRRADRRALDAHRPTVELLLSRDGTT